MINQHTIRLVRSGISALFAQGALHAQLIQVEWEEEKSRLLRMLLAILLGTVCLLLCLIALSAMVLILSWDTPYRIHSMMALIVFYTIGAIGAWLRFQALADLGGEAFADSRLEIATDFELIRSKLDQ